MPGTNKRQEKKMLTEVLQCSPVHQHDPVQLLLVPLWFGVLLAQRSWPSSEASFEPTRTWQRFCGELEASPGSLLLACSLNGLARVCSIKVRGSNPHPTYMRPGPAAGLRERCTINVSAGPVSNFQCRLRLALQKRQQSGARCTTASQSWGRPWQCCEGATSLSHFLCCLTLPRADP